MKPLLCAIALLLLTITSRAQPIQRQPHEAARQFVLRFAPPDVSATPTVIETRWNNRQVIITFYRQLYYMPRKIDPEQHEYHRLIGRVFVKQDSNMYRNYLINNFEQETDGADPVIESVFFANANDEPGKELFVIVSWGQHHADIQGKDYGTYAYSGQLPADAGNLEQLQQLSALLDGGCDCMWSDGTFRKAIFKTAAAIQAELEKMGYKQ